MIDRLLSVALCLLLCSTANAEIEIDNVYVPAAPPGSMAMAAYMTIGNLGDEPRTIVAVQSVAFAAAHIHQTKINNGVSSMTSMHHVTLAPGQSISLQPGGMHIMLMKPVNDTITSTAIPLTLQFKNGEIIELQASIRALN